MSAAPRSRGRRGLALVLAAAALAIACRRGAVTEDAPPDSGYVDLEQMYRDMARTQPGEGERWSCYERQMSYARHMGGAWGMGGGHMHGPMRGMGMGMRRSSGGMAEWHREMAALHRQLAEDARAAGSTAAADRHEAIAERHQRIAQSVAEAGSPSGVYGDADASGADIFERACSPCHREAGQGVPGAFPPLRNNPIVTEDEDRLIRILLHGMVGPLELGQTKYYGVMPAFGEQLTDAQIARVLTYLRSAWGAQASVIDGKRVAAVRAKYAGRSRPWTTVDLGAER